MDFHEWLVFTCRACRGVIKLSPGMTAKQVICPRCRTKVSVPKDAAIVQEEMKPSQLPAARGNDEMMSQLRGPGREEWEVGNRPIGGDLEFRERLHATSEEDLQPDPDKALRRVGHPDPSPRPRPGVHLPLAAISGRRWIPGQARDDD